MWQKFFCGDICFSHVWNLSVTLSEALIQRCSSVKCRASIGTYYFRIAALIILGEFWKTSVTELIFSIVMSFQYTLCRGCFSRNFQKNFRAAFSKNTADGMSLISCDCSLKISRALFNRLMPGGDKGHTNVSKPPTKTCRVV